MPSMFMSKLALQPEALKLVFLRPSFVRRCFISLAFSVYFSFLCLLFLPLLQEEFGLRRLLVVGGRRSNRRIVAAVAISSSEDSYLHPRRTIMVLLELDPFLNELTKLYEQTKTSGTVWVTLKRSTLQRQKKRKTSEEKPAQVPEPSEYRCLVRATDGKKKISCSLTAKDHLRFQTSYATVLKAHMDSLKKKEKRDKKDKKTTKVSAS